MISDNLPDPISGESQDLGGNETCDRTGDLGGNGGADDSAPAAILVVCGTACSDTWTRNTTMTFAPGNAKRYRLAIGTLRSLGSTCSYPLTTAPSVKPQLAPQRLKAKRLVEPLCCDVRALRYNLDPRTTSLSAPRQRGLRQPPAETLSRGLRVDPNKADSTNTAMRIFDEA